VIVVLACDPGGRDTGIVARSGDDVVDHAIITSTSPPKVAPGIDYAHDVVDALVAIETHIQGLGHTVYVGVEGLVTPTTRRGSKWGDEAAHINPTGLMGAAMVYGSVATAFRGRIWIVRPGGHGSQMLRFYPSALVGAREKGAYGGGQLRHCRSAWDIAGEVLKAVRHPELRGT
jgi:hypothetical protein